MNDIQACARSGELIESGYMDWLADRIKRHGFDLFASATNDDELKNARAVHDMSERIRGIVHDNAKVK